MIVDTKLLSSCSELKLIIFGRVTVFVKATSKEIESTIMYIKCHIKSAVVSVRIYYCIKGQSYANDQKE